MKRILAGGMAIVAVTAQSLPASAAPGVVIDYWFPKTTLVATATATLMDCGANPKATVEMQLSARPDVDLNARHSFVADGLRSGHVTRDLTITLDDKRRLSGLGSDSQDQTGSIIGSIVKIGLNILGAVVGVPPNLMATHAPLANVDKLLAPADKCTASTISAVNRAEVLRQQIAQLRAEPWRPGTPVADPEPGHKKLDTLVAELAGLESGPLRVTVSSDVSLLDQPAGPIAVPWPAHAFATWFTNAEVPGGLQSIRILARTAPQPKDSPLAPKADKCSATITIPRPAMAAFDISSGADVQTNVLQAPVEQWGGETDLCLDVGRFESRKVTLALDSFGMTTSVGWVSNARTAAALSAVAGASDAAAQFQAAHPQLTPVQQASGEADLAEAQVRNIQAQACLAKVRMGATCDQPAPPPPPQ